MLDSVEITPHKAEAAEELFEVLTNASVAGRRVPVLIACNKMDLEAQAHSLDFIRWRARLDTGGGMDGTMAAWKP